MRKVVWAILFGAMLLTALPIYAQDLNCDPGPVWRVTYFHVNPVQSDAFWKDIRENMKPVYAEFKKEGLISDYKVWLNDTTDHPGDWDVAVESCFRTMRPSMRWTRRRRPLRRSIMVREMP
jgi:hypothetical protein